jgi:biotin transport system substrate-specific component
MDNKQTKPLLMIVFSALFTALVTLGSFIAIPIGPVPIVLANFFIFLTALLLGSRWGSGTVIVYLLLGLIGLPVFSKGGAGYQHLFGPTGGFLFAYVPAAFIAGFISERGKQSVVRDTIALIIGALIIYAGGIPWLKLQTQMTWGDAFTKGMLPFLIPDGIKLAAAVILARFLRPVMKDFITRKGTNA